MNDTINAVATIAINESLSNAIEFSRRDGIGINMPAAIDGTVITFAVSDVINGTFQPLYDAYGTEVTVTMAASRAIALDGVLGAVYPWAAIKIRTGTAASPTVQSAARELKVVAKG